MAGPDGPLAAYGLVSDPELAATQAAVAAETRWVRWNKIDIGRGLQGPVPFCPTTP